MVDLRVWVRVDYLNGVFGRKKGRRASQDNSFVGEFLFK